MQNLEQIRALNAIKATENTKFSGKANGEVVKKVPVMIQQNGILATLAFASEKKKDEKLKNPGFALVFIAAIMHCQSPSVCVLDKSIVPFKEINEVNDSDIYKYLCSFSNLLCQKDATFLRAVTAEIMAFLNYLRRYAAKDE